MFYVRNFAQRSLAYVNMWSTRKVLSEFIVKYKGNTNLIFLNVKSMSSSSQNVSNFEERKVDVDGVKINYLKTGIGEHPVLLLPGSMGSIWTDFKPQIENLNKEKLTIIAWDPPGYGKSRPPNRTFPENFYRRDATWACNLMKALGYNKFSLLGWSDGGMTSLILAAKYPENIRKLIVTAVHSYVTPQEMEFYENIRNVDTWSEQMRSPLIAVYGEEYLKCTWANWVDAVRYIFDHQKGDICKNDLLKITCPTLIVHGEKDVIAAREHPDYLKANISNSRLELFKSGAHNLHLRYADEFNSLVNEFLTE